MQSSLSPYTILGIIAAYFAVLITISFVTSRKDNDNASFFLAGRKSPWPLVAIGMIGASLSGVTFISVPGAVGAGGANQALSYMQVVFGYLLGYLFIATVLLPLYYRLGLTSIYEYLRDRIGWHGYKIGAFYFLLSRTVGASFRLFLVAMVLDGFVTQPLGIPFGVTVAITILLIWLYTFRGGIRTIVYTDTFQTVCLLLAAGLTIYFIGEALETNLGGMVSLIYNSDYSQLFFFEGGWSDPNNFFKQFLSGALITIVMTGLDQDMMQKNLSMPNFRDAQKNMATFSIVLVFANLLFLALGALLYIYATRVGLEIPPSSDQLYPSIALRSLPPIAGVVFILGLVAAAYSSADSALTALTTSFCVDFLGMREADGDSEADKTLQVATMTRQRLFVHVGFSGLLFLVIMAFSLIGDAAVINSLFKAAGYTYGPLLGLFAFGLFTNLRVREVVYLGRIKVPALVLICLLAPVISMAVDAYSAELLGGFQFGFLILAFNGLLTFLGLVALSDFSEVDVPAPPQ
ncbi:sodium:solute symporter [Neolewinella lacunae]|uniref:Sodium:solute symporter n=1 Tax=Neolewinella lacunae TaxID=1517758 RepID=A0A923PKJ7_9BACT|nr:sodium:solute symporter [Neolewinella lacunae]MBC6995792.1 sodium:solute symporter [Neolewinella lacunae]MDN3636515.1 sodium:solute symporter [Neolewinella lacunae]